MNFKFSVMIVCFANQKGGVGKTTLAIAYANHLAYNDKKVILLDTDTQRSCLYKRETDKQNFDTGEILYEIEHHDLPNYESSLELMEKAKLFSKQEDVIVLIDAPGTISESFLIPIFAMSDVIICPFTYQNLVLSSTSLFIRILQELKKEFKYMKAINIFVPNMVRKGVGTKDEWTEWEKTDKIFQEFGKISPRIYYKEELKRINTIFSTTKQREELKNCFAFLDRYIL